MLVFIDPRLALASLVAFSMPVQDEDALAPNVDELAPVRARVQERVASGAVASIAVAVARAGEPLWLEAFGVADRERGLAATVDTPYPVASLTKSMTATAAVILADRGRLDLDAPVAKVLGDGVLRVCREGGPEITLRRVMAMEAGIPHGWISCATGAAVPPIREVLRDCVMVVFPPGEFLYSNYAFAVPEAAIERASGRRFGDFLETELFEALGMEHSFVGMPAAGVPVAASYDRAGTRVTEGVFVPAGAAGAYSSIRDLLRYGAFHLGLFEPTKAILSEAGLRRMPGLAGEKPGYFGFGHAELAGGLRWWISNGEFTGSSSMLTLLPSEQLIVAVLVNQGGGSPATADALAAEIVDALVPGFAGKVETLFQDWESEHALAPYVPSSELIGAWTGQVVTSERPLSFSLTFEPEGPIWATWDEAHEVQLTDARRRDTQLTAGLWAALPSRVGPGEAHAVSLDLRLEGPRLFGSATSKFATEEGSFSIPAYVTLEREEER